MILSIIVFDNEEESTGQKHLEKAKDIVCPKHLEKAKDIVVLCLGSFISPKSDLESRMNNFKWKYISSYLWTKICEVKFCDIQPLVWFCLFVW
jgi:hypothetical protein